MPFCKGPKSNAGENFLMAEIEVLEEAKWIGLPNFMSHTVFVTLLKNKVKAISSMPIEFIDKMWDYLEEVVVAIMMRHSKYYQQLQTCTRHAGLSLIAKMKESSMKYVIEVVEMEKLTNYTCNPKYTFEYNKLMAKQNHFMERVYANYPDVDLEGFVKVTVTHLQQCTSLLVQAFDLKMRVIAYWKIVLRRLIDITALHLQFSIFNFVNKHMEDELVKDITSPCRGGIEKLLEETPLGAMKRDKLRRSIKVLRESKEVVLNIIDKISDYID